MENKQSEMPDIVKKTLLDIKNMYGSKIIRYRHQRPIITEHILEIKEYIETSYNKKEFYLPPITLVPNNNDQFEIIDGLHRCAAIAEKINEYHPCLNSTTYIIYINIKADTISAMQLFMNINKAKPMPRLYFEDDYIKKLETNTILRLKKVYGSDIINDTDKYVLSSKLNKYKLSEIINTEFIEKLIINNEITGLDNNEIYKIIKKTNNIAINYINTYMELDIFSQFEKLNNKNKVDLAEFINKVIQTYNRTNNIKQNDLQVNTIINNIKSIIERWNNVKRKYLKVENKVNILEYKPMVLCLFPRIPIFSLENAFISTELFENNNNESEGEIEPGS
jgi:hypothetical protein